MKIANPLYDNAFKYMMQNDRIAKKVLSTLLECEVVELHLEQQETIATDTERMFTLYRLDFSATILNENGERQKVLIELQKSKLPTNALRFRTYLGSAYKRREIKISAEGDEEIVQYPIIAIYILGYNLADIPYLAVSIDNRIINTVTKEELILEDDFISLLTHKTRIIQVRRLGESRRTRLEQFLLLFNQSWRTAQQHYVLDLQEVPKDFKDIAEYLHSPLEDEQFRSDLMQEEEIELVFKKYEADKKAAYQAVKEAKEREKKERKLKIEERKLKEEAKQREEEAKQREEEAKQREEEAKQREEEAKQREEEANMKLAQKMKKYGESIADIQKETGLSMDFIERL